MKGFFHSITGWVIIVIVALAIVLFLVWARAPDLLANALSKKMKVSVQIDDINLSLHNFEIDQLEIGNPKGSILPKAFSSEQLDIQAPLSRYFDQHVVIDTILINGVYLGLEFNSPGSKKGNWSTIMENFKSSTQVDTKEKEKKQRSVLIKKIILTNVSVDLAYKTERGKIKQLPPIDRIEFTNVTSEGGIPSDQITHLILTQTLRSIFQKENLQDMLQGIIQSQSPEGTIEKFIQPFKGLFNKVFVKESDIAA